ncbi:hypothetical protein CR205_02610 [Alteribacter lacisalsi]|uniref:Uncharacterized protein n=1 Tax=Alteribacter lacisalsi TaxID=2045244 RepID=A0A2W0H9Q0_9BACI|nr:DUF6019 family protein [Alteribacter lacisalsi]PYZ97506.1 hypothetical protein CR205_02610 [Alteribacter lacisalsi]
MVQFGNVILIILGLIVLYFIIESAVRNGINQSKIGRFLEEKHGMKEEKPSPISDDLDTDEENRKEDE